MDIRKHRTLFLLGGIFIVLVLIYLALSSYQWDAGEADSGEDSQIQVKDLGELSSFQFTDQSTGTGMSFVKEDGTRYVQVQDSDLVYLVSSDVLNNLLGIGNSTEE